MLWMYMAMLETAEQKDKIAYIYENYFASDTDNR